VLLKWGVFVGSEFKINQTKIEDIAKKFSVSEDSVEELHKAYLMFSPGIKKQYLAHIMRCLEVYFRSALDNTNFLVKCYPFRTFTPGQKQAVSRYYKGSEFRIYYYDGLSDIKKRDLIAHEVGHLFLLGISDARKRSGFNLSDKLLTEPLCSIFGIFAMSEKNDFYDNYDSSIENHNDWDHILNNFIQIHKGIF
jgi:Zn-dependent peptidase ImmA (M78 family)